MAISLEGVQVRVEHDGDVVAARQKGREMAAHVGFSGSDLTIIATAISEIARNIVVYAKHGDVTLAPLAEGGRRGIQVVAQDTGPGIPNVEQAMRDGFSTGKSLGLGLPGARRLMDEFEISSQVGVGTTVTMRKWYVDAQPMTKPSATIEWSAEVRPFGGAGPCGDVDVVVIGSRTTVVAVADGLGHGSEAAAAAKAAAAVIQQRADTDITQLMTECHHALRHTRGAALSIAVFGWSDSSLIWLGVGNVGAILARGDSSARPERHALLLRGGVVGYRLPPLRPEVLPVFPGDTLIMATDGIASAYEHEPTHGRDPKQLAGDILARHGKESDDALVLVARYLGAMA